MSLEEVLKMRSDTYAPAAWTMRLSQAGGHLPILRTLDWDDANPAEFVPEFPVDSGRVDYALHQAGGQTLVFIEAKRLGGADDEGEEQLFGYAVNKGVPFLILTDGNVWDFYLSMAAGAPGSGGSIERN